MAAEQQEAELKVSRQRLQDIVNTRVEIPAQTLFESVQEVLQVRGGERWNLLDELMLLTPAGIDVFVGWREKSPAYPWDTTNIGTYDEGAAHNYEVRHEEGQSEVYMLYEITNLDTREGNAVSNSGNLAPARLLSILADAHMHTPLES
ncbi:hypothetical protein HY387_01040 [Candidatus Daviesbacteria bacterium]|nr:hypothetical protein [Candidatus Daviesbacteria bacterium]